MATVNEKMTAIADAIRDKTGGAEALTLDDMATDIPKVYDAGKAEESRAWWDLVTNRGVETELSHLFRDADFSTINGGFDPPYTLKPKYATNMFQRAKGIFKVTKEQLDTSACNSTNLLFSDCLSIKEIKGLVLGSSCNYVVSGCTALETIGIVIKENSKLSTSSPFGGCSALKDVSFEGVILNSISFQWSPLLTTESVENIVSVLSNVETGQTLTFKAAVKQTYYNAHSGEYANADEAWDALCDTKPNWTISLV